jgi:hypothetical protein
VFSVVRAGTVYGQRLGKHVHAATDTNATIEERCLLCGPCRDVINKGKSKSIQLRSVPKAVKKGLERVKLKNLQT